MCLRYCNVLCTFLYLFSIFPSISQQVWSIWKIIYLSGVRKWLFSSYRRCFLHAVMLPVAVLAVLPFHHIIFEPFDMFFLVLSPNALLFSLLPDFSLYPYSIVLPSPLHWFSIHSLCSFDAVDTRQATQHQQLCAGQHLLQRWCTAGSCWARGADALQKMLSLRAVSLQRHSVTTGEGFLGAVLFHWVQCFFIELSPAA